MILMLCAEIVSDLCSVLCNKMSRKFKPKLGCYFSKWINFDRLKWSDNECLTDLWRIYRMKRNGSGNDATSWSIRRIVGGSFTFGCQGDTKITHTEEVPDPVDLYELIHFLIRIKTWTWFRLSSNRLIWLHSEEKSISIKIRILMSLKWKWSW